MEGKIVKALSGFYYVRTETGNVYECRARGVFKNEKISPLVGDNVVFQVTDAKVRTGMVDEIKPRKNFLSRPAVANADQAMVIFSIREPAPNFSTLDRFLVLMNKQNIPTIIVFNKKDLAHVDDIKNLKKMYEKSGCKLFFTAVGAPTKKNVLGLKGALKGKITVMAGPSGVGKSTMVNLLSGKVDEDDQPAQVGAISEKAGRGKQTTRHTELFDLGRGYKIIDTPGFSSLQGSGEDFEKEELASMFPEFAPYISKCKFNDCRHIKERDCAVVAAVNEGKIPLSRYNSYKTLLGEVKTKR